MEGLKTKEYLVGGPEGLRITGIPEDMTDKEFMDWYAAIYQKALDYEVKNSPWKKLLNAENPNQK